MKIYSKTGDSGETSLFDGGRVEKDALRVCAYGEIDELNAVLGLARAHSNHVLLDEILDNLQPMMFVLGAELATVNQKQKIPKVQVTETKKLEEWIDQMEAKLPVLKEFIMPGGEYCAAYLHLARAVCRRAERQIITLKRSEDINGELLKYVNRMSDLLFVMARFSNWADEVPELKWKK